MRLFFATSIAPDAVRAVTELQKALRKRWGDPGIRWVSPDQLHYTLQFLGEIDDVLLPEVKEAASRALPGSMRFTLELSGIGGFPGHNAPRVIWVGATRGGNELGVLASRLGRELRYVGFELEERPFKPHLTLARVKGPSAEREAARLLETQQVGPVAVSAVDAFVLMQSTLSPRGSTYSVLGTFPLGSRIDPGATPA